MHFVNNCLIGPSALKQVEIYVSNVSAKLLHGPPIETLFRYVDSQVKSIKEALY